MRLLSNIAILAFYCIHFLPISWIRFLGYGLGWLAYCCAIDRRRIGMTNLRLCFPQQSVAWRRQILRRHMGLFMAAVLERSLMRWSSMQRLDAMLVVSGGISWQEGAPIILLGLHTVGFEFGMLAVARRLQGSVSMIYANQKNEVFNQFLLKSRLRFNNPEALSRQSGIKPAIRAIREGRPLCYLGDQDFGAENSVFVPFFGIEAATITALSRLAKITHAKIIPVTTQMTPSGYHITIGDAWTDFPSEDVLADTRRFNAFVEQEVEKLPEQYFWLHKRFKTRPEGQKKIY